MLFMKVRAKFAQGKYGFDGSKRIYDGDVFEIEPKQFSKNWMEKVEEKRGRKAKEEIEEEVAE